MSAQLDTEFRDFMHSRWPAMVRLAYALTGDQGHAEDVAQAAFALVAAPAHPLPPESTASGNRGWW
jgi:DNA-directed RNA polymerase specialized sigma24 family protein